jgi:hypothetical protein
MTAGGNLDAMRKAMDPETHKPKRARLTEFEKSLRAVKESELEENIHDAASKFGWRYVHFRPARSNRGWVTPFEGDGGFPDDVLVRDARLIIAESKRHGPGNEPRPDQVLWLDALARTDVEVYLFTPADWASGEIVEILTIGCLPHHRSRWIA